MKPNLSSTFIKWFILFALVIAGNVIAASYGLQATIVKSDVSYLSSVIAGLFLVSSLAAGRLAWRASRANKPLAAVRKLEFKRRLLVLNFMPSAFFMIGILGTVVGVYCMMQGNLTGTDVTQMLAQIKSGFSTKLFVTGTGVVSALALHAQILVIEHDLCE